MTIKSNYLARVKYELKTFKGFDGTVNDYAKTWETVDDEIRKDESIGRQLLKSLKIEDILPTDILIEPETLKKNEFWGCLYCFRTT
jgi:hypothetical protein